MDSWRASRNRFTGCLPATPARLSTSSHLQGKIDVFLGELGLLLHVVSQATKGLGRCEMQASLGKSCSRSGGEAAPWSQERAKQSRSIAEVFAKVCGPQRILRAPGSNRLAKCCCAASWAAQGGVGRRLVRIGSPF